MGNLLQGDSKQPRPSVAAARLSPENLGGAEGMA